MYMHVHSVLGMNCKQIVRIFIAFWIKTNLVSVQICVVEQEELKLSRQF